MMTIYKPTLSRRRSDPPVAGTNLTMEDNSSGR
jgi:hypothetical protein